MTQALHEAFVDLATEISPRLPAPAPARLDPWRRAVAHRRRRRAGSFAAALVVVLLGALVVSATGGGLLGRTVTPAVPPPGPGSLPDRIFSTRSSILSVEQAPIGRAALVYDGPLIGTSRATEQTTPIAVGADADVYRSLPVSNFWSLSPDGRTFAYLPVAAADGAVPARLHLLDLGTGRERVAALADEGHGLSGPAFVTLLWSPDSRSVLAQVDVRDHAVGSGNATGRLRVEVVNAETASVSWRAAEVDQALIDWYDSTSILVQDAGGTRAVDAATGQGRQSFGTTSGYLVGSYGSGQQTFLSPDRLWVAATHQDSGAVFHNVRIAALPAALDPQGKRRVYVPYETSNGSPARDDQQPLGWVSTDTLAVKAQTFVEPGAGFGGGVRLVVDAVQVPSLRTSLLMHADPAARVNNLQLAADVLAGGRVRHAVPPQQPLLDLRTLAPAVGLWLHDWWLLILVPVVAIALLLFARRRGRLG